MSHHETIRKLEPTLLWNAFADLNAVPRGSKKEAAVTRFVAERGRKMGLETEVDSIGNVLIRKPASQGFEDRPTVVLQSHIDMVWQKNSDSEFDFDNHGIEMRLDGDWVRAHGTTLGADNGIGVASIFAVLESNSLTHPALECIFTVDEETGMTGAKSLDPSWLKGRVLLNLDTEQDNELTIGCAGGADVTSVSSYQPQSLDASYVGKKLLVRGLKGGHSGMEIHLGYGNANKIMNRILDGASHRFGLRLSSLEGGSLRNAIPRESTAIVVIPKQNLEGFMAWFTQLSAVIQAENAVTDPLLLIACESHDALPMSVLPVSVQKTLFATVFGVVSGIYRMSPSIGGLVQTSNNLARVIARDGEISIMCLARSSVDTERDALSESLASILSQLGGRVTIEGEYPGWQPVPTSDIVKKMSSLYEELFHEKPHVAACHAGLECGIIGSKYAGMEMISFGPNILGAHSPDERVQISSVQKFYRYFLETLARL
jgi:dipeptidase D